jgi:hypothetical protein
MPPVARLAPDGATVLEGDAVFEAGVRKIFLFFVAARNGGAARDAGSERNGVEGGGKSWERARAAKTGRAPI